MSAQGDHDFVAPQSEHTIEQALEHARRKARFYEDESARSAAEARRWTAIAERLQNALDILLGKITVAAPGDHIGQGAPKWPPVIFKKLESGMCPKRELIRYLLEQGCPSEGAAFQAIRQQLKKGTITQKDGAVGLKRQS